MAIIGLDFDGTLVNGDTPLEGAREAVNLFRESNHKVVIYSANNSKWVEKVLNNHDIRYDHIWDDKGKPNCDIFVDNKGYRYQGDWTHEQLEVLKLVEGLDNRKW